MTQSFTFSVLQLGNFPAIRSKGRDGRYRLDDRLDSPGAIDLTIDFNGVEAMSFSFVDEFLGKFLTSHDFGANDATVRLAGLNDDNLYAVRVCVERRETQVTILSEEPALSLLGDQMLATTLDVALRLGKFKANDLAETLGLSASNANNRLKRLTAVGALRKTHLTGAGRGGREYTYEAVSGEILEEQPMASV